MVGLIRPLNESDQKKLLSLCSLCAQATARSECEINLKKKVNVMVQLFILKPSFSPHLPHQQGPETIPVVGLTA